LLQNRSQIEALDEQKRLTEEEIHHVRGQISKARDENDQLRLSIDSQLKKADAREKFYVKNDELIDALEEAAVCTVLIFVSFIPCINAYAEFSSFYPEYATRSAATEECLYSFGGSIEGCRAADR
jgi:hypothetical protein